MAPSAGEIAHAVKGKTHVNFPLRFASRAPALSAAVILTGVERRSGALAEQTHRDGRQSTTADPRLPARC
jgi:hypothetical protein